MGWMADRFQERHATPLGRQEAERAAEGCLGFFEEVEGPFGQSDYDWSQDGAHILADEEIDTCWEQA